MTSIDFIIINFVLIDVGNQTVHAHTKITYTGNKNNNSISKEGDPCICLFFCSHRKVWKMTVIFTVSKNS